MPGKINHGEGNPEADKDYRERTQDYLKKGRTEKDAQKAKDAVESGSEDLSKAEEVGKSHARR